MPFVNTSGVLALITDDHAQLEDPLIYLGRTDAFLVPDGFVTDFASVPRVFTWLVPKMGTYTRAAILHDWLCEQLNNFHADSTYPQPPASGRDTDGIFRRVCREEGTGLIRRWLLWTGVRWGALANPARRAQWWKDAPAVLALSAAGALLTGGVLVGVYSLVALIPGLSGGGG